MTNEERDWVLANMRYDAMTGVLERWVTHSGNRALKNPRWKACSGKAVSKGHAHVSVLGSHQQYHRVCWLIAHGEIDDSLEIDHINGVRNDNRLINLRLGTSRDNNRNRQIHREGKLCGCSFHKRDQKWGAYIYINGKQRHLGLFSTEIEAHAAYMDILNQVEVL
jgi:hypothetical protein